MKLLTVEDARARMIAAARPTPAETATLSAAVGRTLAEDVRAIRDQPPFDASAMDGWAVRSADAPGRLRIIGESAAGHALAGALGPGEAARIFTGAPAPAGADAIVIQEDAVRDSDFVEVPAVVAGHHLRRAGGDFRAGETLLAAGTRLDPWRLSLAAAAGRAQLSVARRPRVALLSTGEEIVEPGGDPGPFQIFDSGTTALVARCQAWGADPRRLSVVGDDLQATAEAVRAADCDLVVTIGGASVGDHDLVKPAMGLLGLELVVESIAMRPGKPTWFGTLADGRRVLGLPGNPASALACAELFLGPVLLAMQGAAPGPRMIRARAGHAFAANGAREHWMRARLSHADDGAVVAQAFGDQDSSLVSVFANADALIRRPAGAPALSPGDPVEALPLERA